MPGFWGSHLGIIDFELEKVDNEWTILDGMSSLRSIEDVEADEDVREAVADEHQATKDYVNAPVGETSAPLYSYFSQVQDDPTVQIVSDAQMAYVEKYIQGTELEGLPVLSAAAPFKAGRDGVTDFTDIEAGGIAIKDTTSLYKYPNTIQVLKLNGAEVREWLEWSAGQFYQIDPNSTEEQLLVRPNTRSDEGFPSYNFDIIDGVSYQIDVTQPARYDKSGEEVINPDSHRIVNLQYNGEEVSEEQVFLVATNNYRASATPIANPGGDNIVIESPDENRQALVNYIRDNGEVNPSPDNNWSLAPIDGDVNLTFHSSPEAQKYTGQVEGIEFLSELDNGFAKYSINLAATSDNNDSPDEGSDEDESTDNESDEQEEDQSSEDVIKDETQLVKNDNQKVYSYSKEAKSVTINKEAISELDQDFSVELSNGKATLLIPNKLFPEGKDVTINFGEVSNEVAENNKDAVSELVDFSIIADGEDITEFSDNPITVTFTVDKNKVNNWEDLKVVYIDENGDQKEIISPISYNKETGEVVAELTHFSAYGVFEIASADNGEVLPDTATNQYNWLMVGGLLLVFGTTTLFAVRRKRLQN
ncbi:5'-nucleotidase C-terminal domain-containing protein [Paraliobacillus quinghaiensis]|nr:5'-nucleotidase C-terminal domain-containing protein [Paraliobacillus quinghaiensis]